MANTAHYTGSETSVEPQERTYEAIGRRVGYVIAAVLNGVGLWIVNQLLDWEWPPFLTADFESVLPVLNLSFIVGIVVNAAYIGYDTAWFKSSTQIVANGVSLAVAIRMYQVFPVDFTPYDFDWDLVARIALIVGMVAVGIATILEVGKLAREAMRLQGRGYRLRS